MILLLIACAPGPFTEEEAEAVYGAVSGVNEDVYALVWSRTKPLPTEEDLDTASEIPLAGDADTDSDSDADADSDTAAEADAKGMQWHNAAEGGSFEGTVDGPGSWTGIVALTGTYGITAAEGDDWAYSWDMDASYQEVGFGTVELGGDVRWEVVATYEGGRLTHTSTVVGDLVGGGSAAGTGEISTVTRVTLSGGRYVVTVAGTIGGWDVSREYDASAYGL